MNEAVWVFAGITLFGLAAYCLQVYSIRSSVKAAASFHRKGSPGGGQSPGSKAAALPGISILKPLKGIDDNLFDNLESFCTQDYQNFEIIFALQNRNDPAYRVAEKIKEKHSDVAISIVVGRYSEGLNPKINNLVPAYESARHPIILISDSNVMVRPDYLKAIVRHLEDPAVGLVSNVIRGAGARSFGSVLENLHLNSFVMGSVCFLDRFLKMPCVVGKSMLMRKSDIESIGGLKAFRNFLGEDFVIGREMHRRGKKVVLSNYLITNVNQYWQFRRFLNRHTRWGKLRWRIGGANYFFEALTNPVFCSSLALLCIERSLLTFFMAAISAAMKISGDYYIGRKVQAPMNPLFYLASPLKDLIIGIIWFVPLFSSTVEWRGNWYRIGGDSLLSPAGSAAFGHRRTRLFSFIKARMA